MINSRSVMSIMALVLILLHSMCFAEIITLNEVVVWGDRETDNEEVLDIRDVRKTPARDVGEALKLTEGLHMIRK